MENSYNVVDSFCVRDRTVLVLDRDFDSFDSKLAIVDGVKVAFELNPARRWVVIKKAGMTTAKTVQFC